MLIYWWQRFRLWRCRRKYAGLGHYRKVADVLMVGPEDLIMRGEFGERIKREHKEAGGWF